MRQATLALILGLLGCGLFVTAVALAAPSQPAAIPPAGDSPLYDNPITGTDTYSPTTHPVASAIAEHFDVEYSKIAGHHFEEGLGFGIIARIYFKINNPSIERCFNKKHLLKRLIVSLAYKILRFGSVKVSL